MKVILIDDEKLALDYLEHQLLAIGGIEVIGKYTNPFEGAKIIKDNKVDIIFLDIQMPEIEGLDLAEKLLEEDSTLNIVFVTAYQEYAIKAFELNALDYLLKPINKDRLLKTLNRIKELEQDKLESNKDQANGELRLNFFQGGLFQSGGEFINLKWRTKKAEEIFHYLIHNKGTDVSREKLMELMWEDNDIDKVTQQLYTAIYQLRKTLSIYKDNFVIKNSKNGYRLSLHNVKVDIDEFDELIKTDSNLDENLIKRQ